MNCLWRWNKLFKPAPVDTLASLSCICRGSLLLMNRNEVIRTRVLRSMAARPRLLGRLLAVHIGVLRPWEVCHEVFDLAVSMLGPGDIGPGVDAGVRSIDVGARTKRPSAARSPRA